MDLVDGNLLVGYCHEGYEDDHKDNCQCNDCTFNKVINTLPSWATIRQYPKFVKTVMCKLLNSMFFNRFQHTELAYAQCIDALCCLSETMNSRASFKCRHRIEKLLLDTLETVNSIKRFSEVIDDMIALIECDEIMNNNFPIDNVDRAFNRILKQLHLANVKKVSIMQVLTVLNKWECSWQAKQTPNFYKQQVWLKFQGEIKSGRISDLNMVKRELQRLLVNPNEQHDQLDGDDIDETLLREIDYLDNDKHLIKFMMACSTKETRTKVFDKLQNQGLHQATASSVQFFEVMHALQMKNEVIELSKLLVIPKNKRWEHLEQIKGKPLKTMENSNGLSSKVYQWQLDTAHAQLKGILAWDRRTGHGKYLESKKNNKEEYDEKKKKKVKFADDSALIELRTYVEVSG